MRGTTRRMIVITPFDAKAAPDRFTEIAEQHFLDALEELARIQADLKTSTGKVSPAIILAIRDARKATQTIYDERKRLEQSSKSTAGIAHSYAIDLDAARDEIRRRLACLGAEEDAREIPE